MAALLTSCLALSASEAIPEGPVVPPMTNPHAMGAVAIVGAGRIGADQVFELWTPIWYETLAKVRNGKMDAIEGDVRLLEEWRRAITVLVKDEVFFQEADREHNSMINRVVDNFRSQCDPRPRSQIAGEVRRLVQQDMDRYFRQLNADLIKESGGAVKLHKVLEGRGLTFLEWQNRLKRKAFTQSYLNQILRPRAPAPGPKQVQDYYSSHPEEFAQPGAVRFRHIFFSRSLRGEEKARDDAIEVWQAIMDGEISFEAAAERYSDDEESKRRGGFESGDEAPDPEREAWLADIRTALREEKQNEVAPILESPFGCHLAVLLSIGPERKIPFGEVRRDIERKLQSQIWDDETDRYFRAVRRNANIRILMPDFPSHLSCAAQARIDFRHPTVYQMANPQMRAGR
ncbi:MAG: peptidylprolyl isomerase [Planctomycetes bacterium]|nr:peptidylprolyl isomerase [Planctomycetota bacterium]